MVWPDDVPAEVLADEPEIQEADEASPAASKRSHLKLVE
jgi:hypothetical protein